MKKIFLATLLAVAVLLGNAAVSSDNNKAMDNNAAGQNQVKIEMKTSMGDVTLVLYNETPQHRDNFVKLVREGYYDGVLFHRVIKNFMVQTGDGSSRNATPDQRLGAGDVNYTIPAEFVFPKYFHKRGALAAARTGDEVNPLRASSGSQFYIVTGNRYSIDQLMQMKSRFVDGKKEEIFRKMVMELRDTIQAMQQRGDQAALMALQNELIQKTEAQYALDPFDFTDAQLDAYTTVGGAPHLDGQYTVFGEVLTGMDVIEKIENVATGAADRPIEDVRIVSMKVIE